MTQKTTKRALRRFVGALPGGKAFLRRRANRLTRRRLAGIGDARAVFQHHYENNTWNNPESVSGTGSTVQYTEGIRQAIPALVAELGVSTFLDAPCGDFNWFRLVEWSTDVSYIGGDIVEPLVRRNQELYGDERHRFIDLDIVNDELPAADLWLCRDCLFHLSDQDVLRTLDNFLRSDIRYLLTSTHPDCDRNHDIPTGSSRFINLLLPPFHLSEPIRVIDDWIEGYPVRHLGLWERESLKRQLASNKALRRAARRR